jgi:aldehyde dehydrogenase (NAD+)
MTDTATRPAVHLHIAGERMDKGSGGVHEHIDPSTGQTDARIPLAGPGEVDRAVNAADGAFRDWRRTPPEERRRLLLRLADLMEANAEEFGRRGTMDNGTPASVVGGMTGPAVEWTRYYAGWTDKIAGELSSNFGSGVGELNLLLFVHALRRQQRIEQPAVLRVQRRIDVQRDQRPYVAQSHLDP